MITYIEASRELMELWGAARRARWTGPDYETYLQARREFVVAELDRLVGADGWDSGRIMQTLHDGRPATNHSPFVPPTVIAYRMAYRPAGLLVFEDTYLI